MTEIKLTEKYLIEHFADSEDHSYLIESYYELMNSFSNTQFRFFVTVTFSLPVTDEIDVSNVNRRTKRFIKRFFHGNNLNNSNIKFLFVNETHLLDIKQQSKYHVHFLMSDVTNSKRVHPQLPDELRLARIETTIIRELCKIKTISLNSRARVKKIVIEKIYDQENLADYLLKELKQNPHELYEMIDFENSDIDFSRVRQPMILTSAVDNPCT